MAYTLTDPFSSLRSVLRLSGTMFLILGLLMFLGMHSVRIVADGWRSRELREEMIWFANPPGGRSADPAPGD